MIHWLAQTLSFLGCTLALCGMLNGPVEAEPSAETTLADQLTKMVEPRDLSSQSRVALAPPPPLQSALPMAEVEAIMVRVIQNMMADWPTKPRILAGSADLRSTLALVRGRQGQEAWRETVTATLRQEAEFVLVGETAIGEGQVTLRLTLVALEDGRVLAKTEDVAVSSPSRSSAANPRDAINAAMAQLQQTVPSSRVQITIGPFVTETSGFETPLGRNLADIAVEAWLTSAHSVTATLRDAPAPVVIRGPAPDSGFFLGGSIRLVNRDRFQLILRLSNGQNLWASRTLDLSALHLPPALQASLDPVFRPDQDLFSRLENWVRTVGPARMNLQTLGGTEGGYVTCKTRDFSDLHRSCPKSLIQLMITSNLSGALVCFSLDREEQFSMILPNAYTAAPWVPASQPLVLPDSLPPLPDGTRMYWPAMGPPSETLITCLLFETSQKAPLQRLDQLNGSILSGAMVHELFSAIKDSGPIGGAAQSVDIIE